MPEPGSDRERLVDPGVALERAEAVDHRESQRRPGQAAAQHDGGGAELRGDVVGDPLRSRSPWWPAPARRARARAAARQPLVVGRKSKPQSEMQCASSMTTRPAPRPAADPPRRSPGWRAARATRAARRPRPRRTAASVASHSSMLVELIVDGPQPGPLGRRDLVAHQREQRRHDERRAHRRARGSPRSRPSRPPTCPSRWPGPPAPDVARPPTRERRRAGRAAPRHSGRRAR